MKNRLLSMLLMACLVLHVGGALAGDGDTTMIGRVTEWSDAFFLLETLDGQAVRVNYGDDTRFEAAWTVGEGDVVQLTHTGRVTRSLPPQVYAETVRSDSVEGLVAQVDTARNRILITSGEAGQVWMALPEGESAADYEDETVRVFFSGVMALSFPAQASAYTVEKVAEVTGTVTERTAKDFMIETETETLRVNVDAHTKANSFDDGDTVTVFYNGIVARSLPGQIYAMAVASFGTQDEA